MNKKKSHLRLVGGRSGSGKTNMFINEISDKLLQQPLGDPLILLVPEQMTFQMEQALLSVPGVQGIIRAQVTSFTRLAWRVLQETGGGARQHIDSTGIKMLLRKILEEQKDKLLVYNKSYAKAGFIEALDNIITELNRYCTSVSRLQTLANNSSNQLLIDKIHDLQLIEQELKQLLVGQYLTAEDYLQLLQDKLQHTCWACEAEVWVDGFYSFTTQELQVLQVLLNNCKRINISCTIDQPTVNSEAGTEQLFVSTKHTWDKLVALAETTELSQDFVECSRRFNNPALNHLEKNWQTTLLKPFPAETAAIQIVSAVNRRAEVDALARSILKKVRDKAYRYRELAIIVRNIADYQELIETTFAKYQIPVFVDNKSSMLHHPLIELVSAALDVLVGNWRYEDVFRCLKTRLLTDLQEQLIIDRLENIVLARGIKGQQWQQVIRHQKYQEQLEQLRLQIVQPLIKLQEDMEAATNCQLMVDAVQAFLERIAVADKLLLLEQAAEEQGQLLLARQHQQALPALQELLLQLRQLAGKNKLQLLMFVDMLDSGLASLQFAHVPPALDQVVVANIDKSRLYNIRCSFVIGINEGVIPRTASEGEFFSEDERELLQSSGASLADSISQKLYEEPFVGYRALTSASDYMWISYPIADEEGASLSASPIIRQVQALFPANKLELKQLDPYEDLAEEQAEYISSPRAVLPLLVSQIQRWRKAYPIEPLWWACYLWFVEQAEPELQKSAERTFASIFASNQEGPLTAATVEQLYGRTITTGVSRLEKQRKCPFAHFAEYGLKLRQRQIFQVQASDVGNIYHEALKQWMGHYSNLLRTKAPITEPELLQQAQLIMVEILAQHNNRIMQSCGKNKYIAKRITEVIEKTCAGLYHQQQHTSFVPVALELAFNDGENIPALHLELDNNYRVVLKGRIDRVDSGRVAGKHYVRIIDYKSAAGKLDLSMLADGSSLQLATYLEVVLRNSERLLHLATVQAAAILYFRMHSPIVEAIGQERPGELREKVLAKYKMEGLILAEKDLVFALDRQLENVGHGYSKILPVYLSKEGIIKATDNALTSIEFQKLRQHTLQLLKAQATDILRGNVAIMPMRIDDNKACEWCPFLSVCQFEVGSLDNQYRVVKKIADIEEFRSLLTEGVEQDGQ